MSHKTAASILAGAILIYTLLFSGLSIARYEAFHSSTYDLGIMTQVTWNTAHGRLFETSIDLATNAELIGSYLGNHVRPILLLIAPLYRLWSDPRLLLILQSLALGLAALPLYRIAYERTDDRRAALIVAACYLAYPALGFLNLFDFHPVALSIPLLFLAYRALQEQRMGLFWAAVVLTLSTKEELVVPLAAWGVVCLVGKERQGVGLRLVALSGAWALISLGVIIPHFNDGRPYRFWNLWAHLPVLSTLTDQGRAGLTMGAASAKTMALFLVHLLLPLGFLPLLGYGIFVVALPSLAYLLLGKQPALHSVGHQYPAVLIPWFFLAIVEGLGYLRGKGDRDRGIRFYRLGLASLIIGTIGINVPLNPVFLSARAGIFTPDPYHEQIEEPMAQIPPEAAVATIGRFGPQLANRRILILFAYPPPFRLDRVTMADTILLDLYDCREVAAANQRARYAEIIIEVLDTGEYGVSYWEGPILLLERGTGSEEQIAAVSDYVANLVEEDRSCGP